MVILEVCVRGKLVEGVYVLRIEECLHAGCFEQKRREAAYGRIMSLLLFFLAAATLLHVSV